MSGLTYSKGASYRDASSIGVPGGKSTIHMPRERRVMSDPLIQGRTTSEFGLPSGIGTVPGTVSPATQVCRTVPPLVITHEGDAEVLLQAALPSSHPSRRSAGS